MGILKDGEFTNNQGNGKSTSSCYQDYYQKDRRYGPESVKKMKAFHTVDGNVNHYDHYGK